MIDVLLRAVAVGVGVGLGHRLVSPRCAPGVVSPARLVRRPVALARPAVVGRDSVDGLERRLHRRPSAGSERLALWLIE